MKELLVQEFLRTHTFRELEVAHGVFASFDKTGRKWSQNYGQLEAKDNDPLACQCRGLILAAKDHRSFLAQSKKINGKLDYGDICPGETLAVAVPFFRFLNLGQGYAAEVNWNDPNLKVMEKVDGSLVICWYDDFVCDWFCATRAVPRADLLMNNQLHTFDSLFRKALLQTARRSFEDFTQDLDERITYCFELTTPLNRIVVDYKDYSITLLGARNLDTGNEIDPNTLSHLGVPIVKEYSMRTMIEVCKWIEEINPLEHEGVVVCDSMFRRIKVKSPGYNMLNKCRDSLATSERNCLEMILMEKEDDIIPFMPQEIIDNLLKIKAGLKIFLNDHKTAYEKTIHKAYSIKPNDKKTFALEVKKLPANLYWSAPFFTMFDQKADSFKDFIAQNKSKEVSNIGSWSNPFLDKLLALIKIRL